MFTAIRRDGGARITSIDPEWTGRVENLRSLAAADVLICPGCKKAMRYRAGLQRRPHFAHKDLSECPLGQQAAEVLEARAKLYLWLKSKYPDQEVAAELDLGIPDWKRPADVVVHRTGKDSLAYWLFDKGPRMRHPLLYAVTAGVQRQVVFTESAQVRHEADPACLELSAALRDFIGRSRYDEPHGRGYLTFLHSGSGAVTIYRGLRCVHPPAVYAANGVMQGALADALISPATGEILFEQDVAALKTWERPFASSTGGGYVRRVPVEPAKLVTDARRPVTIATAPQTIGPDLNAPMRCERCGEMTRDWISATPSKGVCVCRGCLHRKPTGESPVVGV